MELVARPLRNPMPCRDCVHAAITLDAARLAVHHQVDRAIAAIGIRNGASHPELTVRPDGRCSVIEIGARLGAGRTTRVSSTTRWASNRWAACLGTALAAQSVPTSAAVTTSRSAF